MKEKDEGFWKEFSRKWLSGPKIDPNVQFWRDYYKAKAEATREEIESIHGKTYMPGCASSFYTDEPMHFDHERFIIRIDKDIEDMCVALSQYGDVT